MAERRRRRAGIRARVTAVAVVAVGSVLALSALALVAHQRRVLTENLDESLALEAADLEPLVATPPNVLDPVIDDDGVAQLVSGDVVLASTPNVDGRPPIAAPPAGTETYRTIDDVMPGEPPFRVLSRLVATSDGAVIVHVGASTDDVAETTSALARALALTIPLVVALLGLLVWVLVGRTLAPVEAMRSQVAAIDPDDLQRRVADPGTGDEITRLAETMNAMLERLDDAVTRQRRFVADASHELRSPLTRIRTELEVDLARPAGADPWATHRSVLDETTQLEQLVDDLLALARADARASPPEARPVDLDDLVLHEGRRLRATSGDLVVDTSGISAAQVRGDGRQLGRAVANVVDNAARHAASTVTLTLAEHDHTAVLTIADDGPGIPADQYEAVFERFTRLDASRTRRTGGTGLGLAIAREIVGRHGGTITIDPDHRPGARFVIRLPVGGE